MNMTRVMKYKVAGMPLMRHMCLLEPDCRVSDQYLFGPDLLVAPVLESGARERTLYVPIGRWIDLWRSAVYDEPTGGIVPHEARVLEGPTTVTLPAPLEEIPILVRSGAVIPMLPPDVWSLVEEIGDHPIVELTFATA